MTPLETAPPASPEIFLSLLRLERGRRGWFHPPFWHRLLEHDDSIELHREKRLAFVGELYRLSTTLDTADLRPFTLISPEKNGRGIL